MRAFALTMIAAVVTITMIANAGRGGLFVFVNSVPGADLTLHFGLYALLSLAIVSWLAPRFFWRGRLCLVAVLVVLVTLEEMSQSLLASRSYSLMDLLFSIAGLLAGAATALLFQSWVSRRRLPESSEAV
jgi:VanZ family protein